MASRARAQLPKKLLSWFDRQRRDLPWRADRDPYRIWVSEVMLQQTTVAAVVPYFERFISLFPSVQVLAAADEQDVLKLWEGLGYYRRARHLHAAAKQLAEQHHGNLPDDPEVWSALPGIGRYILGAVLSQAFDRRLPIVEANSLRVLTRLHGFRKDPRSRDGQKWLWSAAEDLLPQTRVGDFNQALMELGALVCTNVTPACDRCPLASQCVAHREQLQESIPLRKPAPVKVEIREAAIVIRHRGKILLGRRPPDASRWQNMWEVPHGEARGKESLRAAAGRIAKDLTGLDVSIGRPIAEIRHGVTRFSIAMTCFEAARAAGGLGSPFYTEMRWLAPDQLVSLPLSTPQRKLLSSLL